MPEQTAPCLWRGAQVAGKGLAWPFLAAGGCVRLEGLPASFLLHPGKDGCDSIISPASVGLGWPLS
jgi:hypothetical protein